MNLSKIIKKFWKKHLCKHNIHIYDVYSTDLYTIKTCKCCKKLVVKGIKYDFKTTKIRKTGKGVYRIETIAPRKRDSER